MTRRNWWDGECPFCGEPLHLTYCTSINSVLDPDLAERVKAGTIFENVCPKCGETIRLLSELLYHDMENHAMVQFVDGPDRVPGAIEMIDRFKLDSDVMGDASFRSAGYATRIVESPGYLRDKAIVFAAGLDDRTVEVCKALLVEGEVSPGVPCEAYVQHTCEDGGFDVACFIGDETGVAHVPPDLYKKAAELFDKADRDADGMVIDLDWAVELLRKGREDG